MFVWVTTLTFVRQQCHSSTVPRIGTISSVSFLGVSSVSILGVSSVSFVRVRHIPTCIRLAAADDMDRSAASARQAAASAASVASVASVASRSSATSAASASRASVVRIQWDFDAERALLCSIRSLIGKPGKLSIISSISREREPTNRFIFIRHRCCIQILGQLSRRCIALFSFHQQSERNLSEECLVDFEKQQPCCSDQ